MNDQRGTEFETAGAAAEQWRLRRAPEMLLPLMRAARSTTTRPRPASSGPPIAEPQPNRWANAHRRQLEVLTRPSGLVRFRAAGPRPITLGDSER